MVIDYEVQTVALYDYFAPAIFGIQVAPVISPPPHLVKLGRLYLIVCVHALMIFISLVLVVDVSRRFLIGRAWPCILP